MSLLSRLPRSVSRFISMRNYPRYISDVVVNPKYQRFAKYVQVSEEVEAALAARKPVVALESAIITHGLPHPDNIELAVEVEAAVREYGAVPATIAVINGIARIGLSRALMEALGTADRKNTSKVSRRDLPFITGLGKDSGGTTVAGTMLLANSVGIKVFATGGIGGVHRGAAVSMDISADLMELSRTNVAVVCSGPKPFLDIERTVEYLETAGVPVMTFGDPQAEKVWLPGFYSQDSTYESPLVVQNAKDAALIIYASHSIGLKSGQLFCNPIPRKDHISRQSIEGIITGAVKTCRKRGITGKAVTPFTLEVIRNQTRGQSIPANKALVINNAKQAARIAVELAKLIDNPEPIKHVWVPGDEQPEPYPTPDTDTTHRHKADVLVVGSIAVDLSCDAASPVTMHTSNPSRITETLGGVGTNVATAAHYSGARTQLVSAVGKDISGDWALEQLKSRGMDPTGIQMVPGKSTARYVAFNGSDGEMAVASADMSIFEDIDREFLRSRIEEHPAWVCIDGNLSAESISEILKITNYYNVKVAFEPTSVEKSKRVLNPKWEPFPKSDVSISAPNELELASMFHAAKEMGLFEKQEWFNVIDSINVESSFLNRINNLGREIKVDFSSTGMIQQAIHLSPYFPSQLIKLGAKGVLSVRVIGADDPLPQSVVKPIRTGGTGMIRGLFVEHYPTEETKNIVSVNGVGDTFLGVFLGRLSQDKPWGEAIKQAQRAAVLTLGSSEAVSPDIRTKIRKVTRPPRNLSEPPPLEKITPA